MLSDPAMELVISDESFIFADMSVLWTNWLMVVSEVKAYGLHWYLNIVAIYQITLWAGDLMYSFIDLLYFQL